MVIQIPCTLTDVEYSGLRQRVLKMNSGIEDFISHEMENHMNAYNPVTGVRKSNFASKNNSYTNIPLYAPDGVQVNLEALSPPIASDSAIVYVHGAAFQRRSNDLNLKTADRLTDMSGYTTFVPDYRVGADYTYTQMVDDLGTCYAYIVGGLGFDPQKITFIADSSGCTTALQMIKECLLRGLDAPGKIVLWSPQADEKFDASRIAEGKRVDIALQTNDLFNIGFRVYSERMCAGLPVDKVYSAYGDYTGLQRTRVLIQSGAEEMLTRDAFKLHNIFSEYCDCTLEVYEKMFHNFQTYYSMCDMAHVCWEHAVAFITDYILEKDRKQYA